MDEDVFAIFALDKAKSFSGVKPLYCACLSHFSSTSEIPNFLPYRLRIAEVISLGARSADANDWKDQNRS
jgi:hypothetical protein